MKKKFFAIALMCTTAMNVDAQVYSGDTWMQLPTADLYDTGMMNMYMGALAETSARRKELYYYYCDQAVEAFGKKQWNYVVYYVNEALETNYYSGQIYYIRGYANEQLGNIRAAKKDYRKGKKYNCPEAVRALEYLKDKRVPRDWYLTPKGLLIQKATSFDSKGNILRFKRQHLAIQNVTSFDSICVLFRMNRN